MMSADQARDLGYGLQRLRTRKGLTRYQAAEVCGLPHIVYAALEHGRSLSGEPDATLARAWGALQMYHVARGA
jgi:transcriptional regulator with XRE-family HTH domain